MNNREQLPLITIGTLCYNSGKYVIEAIECVKRQNYPNIQHIIIDDYSTDNSAELVQDWIINNNYDCVFIKHEVNKGVHFGLEEIFALAKGKYLAMISDDLWTDDKLLDQVEQIRKKTQTGMVYGDIMFIDPSGNMTVPSYFEMINGKDYIPPSGNIFRELVNDFFFFIQSSLIDIELFKKLNYEQDVKVISEDWDWQLAIARNYEIHGCKKVYAKYRVLPNSIRSTNWTAAKFNKVFKSHFYMMSRYYNHPLNAPADNELILNKMRSIFWKLYETENCTYTDKISSYLKIFRFSKSVKDFITLISLLLNTGFILRAYAIYKVKRSKPSNSIL